MKLALSSLSLHQRLAALAIALGLLAAFSPREKQAVRVDLGELASLVQKTDDHVSAPELADWILQGESGYRLVDLRTEAEYAAYHIPGAENVPLSTLLDSSLLRNERIVLYSEGGIHGAQAWLLLRTAGYRTVYSLLGGLDAWNDEVLFPQEPPAATPEERLRFEKAAAVARAFGGHPRTPRAPNADGGETMGHSPAGSDAPTLTPAIPVPSVPARAAKPKKKEGC